MLPLATLLFPASPDLLLEEITCEGQILFVTVRSSRRAVACPDCVQESVKVHSRYTRILADVSLMDYAVRLRVQVRRFFCSNAACARTTTASPFADLAVPMLVALIDKPADSMPSPKNWEADRRLVRAKTY